VHGTLDTDTDDVDPWDTVDVGTIVWDEDFTLSPQANQQAMLDLCDALGEFEQKEPIAPIDCWMWDFQLYLNTAVEDGGAGLYETLPIDSDLFDEYIYKYGHENWAQGLLAV
jgi:hypothetical protein